MHEHLRTIAEYLSDIEYNTREQQSETGNTVVEQLHQIQWQLTRIANILEQMAKTK